MLEKMKNKEALQHWFFVVALVLIGFFLMVSLIILNSEAFEAPITGTIENVSPAVDSLFLSNSAYGGSSDYPGGVTVSAGGQETIHLNGTVSDPNGYLDIDYIRGAFYRSGFSECWWAMEDKNYCYAVATCTTQNGSGLTLDFDCSMTLEYWIDATDAGGTYAAQTWLGEITVFDNGGVNVTSTLFHEVNTVTAMTGEASINFGTLDINEATTNITNVDYTYTQQGNDVVDAEVHMVASGLNCTLPAGVAADIPRGNIEWDLTDDGVGGAGGNAITAAPAVDTGFAMPLRTDDGVVLTKDLYFDIIMPAGGIGGSCSENMTLNILPAV